MFQQWCPRRADADEAGEDDVDSTRRHQQEKTATADGGPQHGGGRLQGIVVPLVTPLQGRDELDVAGLERLVHHVLAGGVDAVFVLGTTGEAPSLSYRLRREVVERVCRLVDGRVPVLVGVTDTAFVESVRLAEHAERCGARAAVLSMPYYFPAGQTELLQYVRHVVEAVSLPVVLYNMPSLTKVWLEVGSLQQLLDLEPVVGVKDSSGDLEYFRRVLELRKRRPDWSVLMGPEHLLVESLWLGGDGGVHGGANIFPRLFVECFRTARCGDVERTRRLKRCIDRLQDIYTIGKYASRFLKATKSALSLLGICSDRLAEPFNHFLPPERRRVAAVLSDLLPELHGLGVCDTDHLDPSRLEAHVWTEQR